jgi:putative flippase GtrA
MEKLLKKHAEKLRFGVVGIANTALDFAILFLLVGMGLDRISANFVSTSIAFVFSFFVNKSFTFNSTGGNVKKQFALFIIITVFSLWVIQPIVIITMSWLLAGLGLDSSVELFIAKLVATIASLIWNYIFYSRLVFKKQA